MKSKTEYTIYYHAPNIPDDLKGTFNLEMESVGMKEITREIERRQRPGLYRTNYHNYLSISEYNISLSKAISWLDEIIEEIHPLLLQELTEKGFPENYIDFSFGTMEDPPDARMCLNTATDFGFFETMFYFGVNLSTGKLESNSIYLAVLETSYAPVKVER